MLTSSKTFPTGGRASLSAPTLVEPNGEPYILQWYRLISLPGFTSVTAIADKLGVEFALIHRKRDGKSETAPERMDLLVGDVRDKAEFLSPV